MSKTWQDRITQTLMFLRGWNGGANGQYADAVADHLFAKNTGHALMTTSGNMAQGSYSLGHRDRQTGYRRLRRAIILIHTELLGTPSAAAKTQAAAVPDAQLDNRLNTLIGQAKQNIVNDVNTAWTQLTTSTSHFMQNNQLWVRKSNTSGDTTFNFGYLPIQKRYNLEPMDRPPAYIAVQKDICHIPVTNYPSVQANLGNITATQCTQNRLVVTTQLTGCSYFYQINGADMRAAHLYPAGAIDAQVMCTNLRNSGGFQNGNGGPLSVFGAEAANSGTGYSHAGTWTYAVAVFSGAWQIHAQQQPQGGGAPTYWRVH